MRDFLTALALVFVIEGVMWALLPGAMRAAASRALATEPQVLRGGGVVLAVIGVIAVWLIRGG